MFLSDLHRAAAILREGGVVAFPTETVYGLGANALNAQAAARVFEIKQRPHFDPLIVHLAHREDVERLVLDFPLDARRLAEKFWPGPLTLVLPKRPNVPDLVTADMPTVGVRIPAHPLALQLLREAALPIAAPSANPFGRISPTTAAHVREHLGAQVDLILDGGPCATGVESTVLSLAGEPMLLRPGGLPVEAIEEVIGAVRRPGQDPSHPLAPGQLPQHYAPRTRLRLFADTPPIPTGLRTGLLSLRAPVEPQLFAVVEVLSPAGDLREAAVNLFAALHRLDALGLDEILAQRVPDQGLGLAINDRLSRAARR